MYGKSIKYGASSDPFFLIKREPVVRADSSAALRTGARWRLLLLRCVLHRVEFLPRRASVWLLCGCRHLPFHTAQGEGSSGRKL